jgi:hypothetical protein
MVISSGHPVNGIAESTSQQPDVDMIYSQHDNKPTSTNPSLRQAKERESQDIHIAQRAWTGAPLQLTFILKLAPPAFLYPQP